MRRAVLPATDVEVSRISMGTSRLHHVFSARRRSSLLEAALACGITHFDTSPYYGMGAGESELGRLARRHPGRLTIASKVGLYPAAERVPTSLGIWLRSAAGRFVPRLSRPIVDWSIASAAASLERSLRRLGRDVLDFLLLHEPVYGLLAADEFLAWLERSREAGKLRHWGLAGELSGSLPWIERDDALARVVQTRDSLEGREAEPLLRRGRVLQFTYGYLSAGQSRSAEGIVRAALARNATGSVLVSTRSEAHLERLARAAAS